MCAAGTGWLKKRMPVRRKAMGNEGVALLLQVAAGDNQPDTGVFPGAKAS
jgi:hypothetical protein